MVRDAVRIHEHDVWCGCMRGVVVYQALPQRAADMLNHTLSELDKAWVR